MPTASQFKNARSKVLAGNTSLVRNYLKSGGSIDGLVRQVASKAPRPSWYGSGGWSEKDSLYNAAYWLTFGREIDPGGLAEYRKTGFSPGQMLQDLSASEEAASDGVNPGWFGNEVVDPNTLSVADREYYDIWRSYNPSAPFLTQDATEITWAREGMSLETFEAEQSGAIRKDTSFDPVTGELFNYNIVSPEALAAMGGDLKGYYGNRAGDVYLAPTGTKTGGQVKTGQAFDEGDFAGMSMFWSTGHMNSGLLGSDARKLFDPGATFDIKEVRVMQDPTNLLTPILSGEKEGIKQQTDIESTSKSYFGMSQKSTRQTQGVMDAAGTVALNFIPGVGYLAGIALNTAAAAARQSANAQMGYVDWGTALENTALTAAVSAVPGGDTVLSGALISGATSFGVNMVRGESFSESLEAGLWSAAGSAATRSLMESGKLDSFGASSAGGYAAYSAAANYAFNNIQKEITGSDTSQLDMVLSAALEGAQVYHNQRRAVENPNYARPKLDKNDWKLKFSLPRPWDGPRRKETQGAPIPQRGIELNREIGELQYA